MTLAHRVGGPALRDEERASEAMRERGLPVRQEEVERADALRAQIARELVDDVVRRFARALVAETCEPALVESREHVREEELAVRVAGDFAQPSARAAGAHGVLILDRAVVCEDPALANERVRVLEARGPDRLLPDVRDEQVPAALRGERVEAVIIDGRRGASVESPRVFAERVLRVGIVDGDAPSVAMLTREVARQRGASVNTRPNSAGSEATIPSRRHMKRYPKNDGWSRSRPFQVWPSRVHRSTFQGSRERSHRERRRTRAVRREITRAFESAPTAASRAPT